MKKIIILALVGLAGWQIYAKQSVPTITNADLELLNTVNETVDNSTFSDVQFSCDGRQHCSQMTSRAEAVYFIQNCPNTKMDGDYDGIPCENDSRF
ncbi:excalibur calcium-binding domain-containing protein [Vibrio sp. 1151_11]|uniref:excalibur calcium-binding domain-containing protein n=1 Tax=Vibrio sp. 1151_11 TaxID=2527670 RepID=UPI002405EE19|nr:excalibur calcium-binding domain-containing protein [Vibrio sp. 1151_11]MDF9387606.1 excalibur calcium-binding domain-containing protein [Vibrio sp. 1151_11]